MRKPGLGQRLAAAIKAKGYADPDAKFGVKVTEFGFDYRYPSGHIYKWLGDVVMPDYETILRLARDLDTSPGWLHYGEDEAIAPKAVRRQGRRTAGSLLLALSLSGGSGLWPSGGGLAEAGSLRVVQVADNVSLLRRWLRKVTSWVVQPLLPQWCPA